MVKGLDYYDTLGVSRDATLEEIRAAYFDAAKRLHPDVNPTKAANEAFLIVQEAYDLLINPMKRAAYDATLPQNPLATSVSINYKFSRSIIPNMGEQQLMYVLMDIICTANTDELNFPPVHVCLVIDRSTSMAGARMDMVKANVSRLIQKLKPKDLISVVAFSDRATVILPPTNVQDKKRIEHEINLINTEGGTELLQGMAAGITQLRFSRGGKAITELILLTDGHTYGDEEACLDLARQAAQESITISALGIGNEWNDVFLDKMTSLCGGNVVFAATPEDLSRYMQHKLESIEKVFAKNVNFRFQCDEWVQPRFIFRLNPEISPLPLTSPLSFGNLQFGRSISVLFEFLVRKLPAGMTRLNLASGKLEMEIPKQGSVLQYLEFRRKVMPDPEPELPPAAILEAMSRLTLYRLQEKARAEVSQGEVSRASKHLQYLATHLLSNGKRELAHTVLVEAEHIRQSQRFSADGEKQIKYGTRALLLPPGQEYTEQ